MKIRTTDILLFFLFLGSPGVLLAQQNEKIDEDWIPTSTRTPIVEGRVKHLTKKEKATLKIKYWPASPFDFNNKPLVADISRNGKFSLKLEPGFEYQSVFLQIGDGLSTYIIAHRKLLIKLNYRKAIADTTGKEKVVHFRGSDRKLNTYWYRFNLYLKANASKEISRKEHLNDYEKTLKQSHLHNDGLIFRDLVYNVWNSEHLALVNGGSYRTPMADSTWKRVVAHRPLMASYASRAYFQHVKTFIEDLRPELTHPDWKEIAGGRTIAPVDSSLFRKLAQQELQMRVRQSYDTVKYKALRHEAFGKYTREIVTWRINVVAARFDKMLPPRKADFLKLFLPQGDPVEKVYQWEALLPQIQPGPSKDMGQKMLDKLKPESERIKATLVVSQQSAKKESGKFVTEMPFGAKLYVVDSVTAKEFIIRLRRQFPDKALVVDFWATWCSPCIEDMPHSIELQKSLAKEDVVFVFVCSDFHSFVANWKQKVAWLKTPGYHFFVNPSVVDQMQSGWGIEGFPGYAIVNKAGEFRVLENQEYREITPAGLMNAINKME